MVTKNKLKAISILTWILSVLSALLYRAGGWGKPFKSWNRDWLVPPLAYGFLFFIHQPNVWYGWLMLIPAILLTGAALTTYWDKLFNDVDNFYMHGFMVGLGAFPFFWAGVHWYMILIRAIILGASMGLINWVVNKYHIKFSDWIEELSRGFLILITVKMLWWFTTL